MGTFFCPPRCPARPIFFSQPHACKSEKMAKQVPLSWATTAPVPLLWISERPCPLSWGLAAHPAQLADHPQVARGAAAGAAWHPNGRPSKGPWAVPAAVPAWLVLAGGSCTLPWIPLPRPALLPQLFHRLTRAYASANSLSPLLRPSQRFRADLNCL